MFLITVAGGLGAALRYLLDTVLQERAGVRNGWSIFFINVIGSFVFGLASGVALGHNDVWWPAAIVGMTGGFTTFSAATVDVVKAANRHAPGLAWMLALGQMAACILAVGAGYALTQ